MSYPIISEQERQTAIDADLTSYLLSHGETVKKSGREYLWESPSGKVSVSGNRWYSHYEQTGGGPVSFVRRFFGKTYPEAVRDLLGQREIQPNSVQKEKPARKDEPKELVLPPKNENQKRLYAYLLRDRCLDRDVVRTFIHEGLLYEDAEYHNAVFVGTDKVGIPQHIHKRSTGPQSSYKVSLAGSHAEYGFHYVGQSDRLYVFEAPIDLLAYISLHKTDWQKHSYVALCSTADCAALWMLDTYPNLKTVYLCLDHDSAGIEGAYRIAESIHEAGTYDVFRIIPKNKDWDEDLKERNGRTPIPCGEHRKLEQMKEKIDGLSEQDPVYQEILQSYRITRGYLQEYFLHDLERSLDGQNYESAAKCTLAYLSYRGQQMESATDCNTLKNALQEAYKLHRDKDDGKSQISSLRRSFGVLKAQLQEKDLFSFQEEAEQKQRWIGFAVDCLRLSCCLEREQTSVPKTDLGQTLE